jgi:hypothetical protein
MIFEDAMAVLAAMEREDVSYVMVGSMAMAADGVVRASTRLTLRSWRAYPVVQYFSPGEAYSVDIIARLGEAFAYDRLDARMLQERFGLEIA